MGSLRTMARRLLPPLLLLVIAVAPTQWSLPLPGRFHLTLADLLLCLALPVGLVAGVRFWRLPVPHLLFLGLALVSTLAAGLNTTTLKELFQLWLYFGGATALALTVLADVGARGLQRAAALLMVSGYAILMLAFRQYQQGSLDDPLLVGGSFGNRNVLGGYLALLLPLAFGIMLTVRNIPVWLALLVLLLGGLHLMLSGPAWLAVALALAALAAWRGSLVCEQELAEATPRSRCRATLRRHLWFPLTTAALIALFTLILPGLRRNNTWELLSSMALYDDTGAPSRRYPEWQAATLMALERPWVGVGPGAYQQRIGEFYGVVPRATGPSEPDIQNLYLVLGSTLGLPALAAFLLLLGSAIARGMRHATESWKLRNSPGHVAGRIAGIEAGLAAAVAAFALTAIWHPLLVRGIGLPLALALAALHHPTLTATSRPVTES